MAERVTREELAEALRLLYYYRWSVNHQERARLLIARLDAEQNGGGE